jgi:hypothetical protein
VGAPAEEPTGQGEGARGGLRGEEGDVEEGEGSYAAGSKEGGGYAEDLERFG